MLSVFITPWAKPTACQSAMSSAVRRATSASSAGTGSSSPANWG